MRESESFKRVVGGRSLGLLGAIESNGGVERNGAPPDAPPYRMTNSPWRISDPPATPLSGMALSYTNSLPSTLTPPVYEPSTNILPSLHKQLLHNASPPPSIHRSHWFVLPPLFSVSYILIPPQAPEVSVAAFSPNSMTLPSKSPKTPADQLTSP